MNYIALDLEFNQDFDSIQPEYNNISPAPIEIIQIGALKLNAEFTVIASFDKYVKPTFYSKVAPYITDLTGITTEQLQSAEIFSAVYNAFIKFIAGSDATLCVWGTSDIKALFKNVQLHHLNSSPLPANFIDVQPYTSVYLKYPSKRQLRLEHAVEELGLAKEIKFHNALHDALYTAEILKKIYNPYMLPKAYDPTANTQRQRQLKKTIDTDALIKQFEKMYSREMTDEERGIILLAYKMGKTQQFLKHQ